MCYHNVVCLVNIIAMTGATEVVWSMFTHIGEGKNGTKMRASALTVMWTMDTNHRHKAQFRDAAVAAD